MTPHKLKILLIQQQIHLIKLTLIQRTRVRLILQMIQIIKLTLIQQTRVRLILQQIQIIKLTLTQLRTQQTQPLLIQVNRTTQLILQII